MPSAPIEITDRIRSQYFEENPCPTGYMLNECFADLSPDGHYAVLTVGYWKQRKLGLGSKGLLSRVSLFDLHDKNPRSVWTREFRSQANWHEGYVDNSGLVVVYGSDDSGMYWLAFALNGLEGHGRAFGRIERAEGSLAGIDLCMEYYDAKHSFSVDRRGIVGRISHIRIRAVPHLYEVTGALFDSVPPFHSKSEREEYLEHLRDLKAIAQRVPEGSPEMLVANYIIRYAAEAEPHLTKPWLVKARKHIGLSGLKRWIRQLEIRKELGGAR